jgi:hypothetical protein
MMLAVAHADGARPPTGQSSVDRRPAEHRRRPVRDRRPGSHNGTFVNGRLIGLSPGRKRR